MESISPFSKELKNILSSIESLKSSLPLLLLTIDEEIKNKSQEKIDYIKRNAIEETKDGQLEKIYHLPIEHYYELNKFNNQLFNLRKAKTLLPNSFLVSMISQYDAFIGGLIRIIFVTQPELLNSSEKKFQFSQIMQFNNFDEAREYIIEKEIDSILRNSHVDQIKWLENKLILTLTKDLQIWQSFVEITERRNLLVHTDGRVSDQYLSNCKAQNVIFPIHPIIGECLQVDEEYFKSACDCFYEFCVKLLNVIWRKLIPDEISKSDLEINQICLELLSIEEYELALNLLEFGTTTLKKHPVEQYYLFMMINKAQAYKWTNNEDKNRSIINSIDWTAKSDQFLLAKMVLLEEYESAGKMMVTFGKDGPLSPAEYKSWPLFKEFRNTEIFKTNYEKIFKEKLQLKQSAVFSTEIDDNGC